MSRLTTDKPVEEMGMYELAHNCCYVGEDGAARYRDFETNIDARVLARKLMVDFGIWTPDMIEMTDDEKFDWTMLEELSNADVSEKMYADGLIPLFYHNLWAMADLHARLKAYEDAEEQGLLLRLPCKEGSVVYVLDYVYECKHNYDCKEPFEHYKCEEGIRCEHEYKVYRVKEARFYWQMMVAFSKTVFSTKEEAEAAVEKMKSEV